MKLTIINGPDSRTGADVQDTLGTFGLGTQGQFVAQGQQPQVVLHVWVRGSGWSAACDADRLGGIQT